MKKRLISLTLALVMCLSLVPATLAYGPPIDIYIVESDEPAITVQVGATGTLHGEAVSMDSDRIAWSSSDTTGLSIDAATGAYTAHRAGTYTLTAALTNRTGIPATITITVAGAAKPAEDKPAASAAATPSATKLTVDGKSVAVDAYLIGGNNYIKLRDLATMVNGTGKNFNVSWDGSKNAINLVSHTAYVSVGGEMSKGDGKAKTATLTTSAIYTDGVETALTAYFIGGNNYFKLRDVMAAFDIYVGWDAATGTASVDTTKGYTQA